MVNAGARPRPNEKKRGQRVSILTLTHVFVVFVRFPIFLWKIKPSHRLTRSRGRVWLLLYYFIPAASIIWLPAQIDGQLLAFVWKFKLRSCFYRFWHFVALLSSSARLWLSSLISRCPSHLNHPGFRTLECLQNLCRVLSQPNKDASFYRHSTSLHAELLIVICFFTFVYLEMYFGYILSFFRKIAACVLIVQLYLLKK